MDPTCCMRRSQAVTHEHHVLHITYPCQKRKDATHSMRPALAITRRPVALHIRSACDNASTRHVAYQGPLILRVPVLGNDSYMCLSRRWAGIPRPRLSLSREIFCPCHDRRRGCSSSCRMGQQWNLGHYPDPDFLDVLLKLDAGVIRDEDLEPGFDGSAQENAVSEAEPALSTNGRCLVVGKLRGEWSWKTLINENSQRTLSPLRAPALRRPVPC